MSTIVSSPSCEVSPASARPIPPLLPIYIDGEFVATEARFENRSPVTGEVISMVCEAGPAEVERAVAAAKREQGNS